MSRAERKTFHDLLEENPEGLEIRLDNFYDVADDYNPDPFDRIVASSYDEATNTLYSGVCTLKTPSGMTMADVAELKAYLKTSWNRGDPIAFLRSGDTLPILEPPTGGIPEAVTPGTPSEEEMSADDEAPTHMEEQKGPTEETEPEDTRPSEDIGEKVV